MNLTIQVDPARATIVDASGEIVIPVECERTIASVDAEIVVKSETGDIILAVECL